MPFVDILFGKPLANSDERGEQVGSVAGIPIFGLDALCSAAYGSEAALMVDYVLNMEAKTRAGKSR